MQDYTITATDRDDLTDGWGIALEINGRRGVHDVESGGNLDVDPDAWITRDDGFRMAVSVDVEETRDDDGEIESVTVIAVTWAEYEPVDADDPNRLDLADPDGVIVEDSTDIMCAVNSIAEWAAEGAATCERVMEAVMEATDLDDMGKDADLEWVEDQVMVTRADGEVRDVAVEFRTEADGAVSMWRVCVFAEGALVDTNGFATDGWRWAEGTVPEIAEEIAESLQRMVTVAAEVE